MVMVWMIAMFWPNMGIVLFADYSDDGIFATQQACEHRITQLVPPENSRLVCIRKIVKVSS